MKAECPSHLGSLMAGAVLAGGLLFAVQPSAQMRTSGPTLWNPLATERPVDSASATSTDQPRAELIQLHSEISLRGHLQAPGQAIR